MKMLHYYSLIFRSERQYLLKTCLLILMYQNCQYNQIRCRIAVIQIWSCIVPVCEIWIKSCNQSQH